MDRFLLLPFVITQNIAQLCAPPCATALGVACHVALSLRVAGLFCHTPFGTPN